MSLLTALTGLFAGLLARDSRSVNEAPPPALPAPPQFDARALYDALVGINGDTPGTEPFRLYTTRQLTAEDAQRTFAPARPPKGVVPDGVLAMDSLNNPLDLWGSGGLGGLTEGMFWLGFPFLAELAQRTEYRRISETIAKDMTRRWFRLQATGDDDKTDKIQALEECMKHHKLQEKFTLLALLDGFFGRGHLYIDTGDTDDKDLLKLPLPIDPRMIVKGSLERPAGGRADVVLPASVQRQRSAAGEFLPAAVLVGDGQGNSPHEAAAVHRPRDAGHAEARLFVRRSAACRRWLDLMSTTGCARASRSAI